jgi:hypothetical protein
VEKAVAGVAVVFHLAAMSKIAPSLKDPSMVNFCLENNVIGRVTPLPRRVPDWLHGPGHTGCHTEPVLTAELSLSGVTELVTWTILAVIN